MTRIGNWSIPALLQSCISISLSYRHPSIDQILILAPAKIGSYRSTLSAKLLVGSFVYVISAHACFICNMANADHTSSCENRCFHLHCNFGGVAFILFAVTERLSIGPLCVPAASLLKFQHHCRDVSSRPSPVS